MKNYKEITKIYENSNFIKLNIDQAIIIRDSIEKGLNQCRLFNSLGENCTHLFIDYPKSWGKIFIEENMKNDILNNFEELKGNEENEE